MTSAVAPLPSPTMREHPWRLLGPWYRWATPNDPRAGRVSRPQIQKYETSDLVTEFLANPQRSLKFLDEDRVYTAQKLNPIPVTAQGRRSRFTDYQLIDSGVRKLFLDSHKRFYLVVCELHCDMPGLPTTSRDQACEAGFVVRRRHVSYPDDAAPRALELLGELRTVAAKLAKLERVEQARADRIARAQRPPAQQPSRDGCGCDTSSATAVMREAVVEATTEIGTATRRAVGDVIGRERAELLQRRDAARAGLLAWRAMSGAHWLHEGWVPTPGRQGVGAWELVEEEPQTITETVFPLYPVIPDPRLARHAAKGKSLYFGLVPTSASDADASGRARFDSGTLYEIRCFVRRHTPECPRTPERGDCRGELVWSAPTEAYQHAAHFDLVGTSKRPVTIQLPDLPSLAAQAAAGPPGAGSQRAVPQGAVQMVQPASSVLKFGVSGGIPSSGSVSDIPQICFFSIPLITIVAWFVLNLFLPIVVLIFNLYFLLALKFCIPPSLSVAAGGTLDVALTSLELGLDAGLDVEVAAFDPVRSTIRSQLDLAFDTEVGGQRMGGKLLGTGPSNANLGNAVALGFTRAASADHAADPPPSALEYEIEVPLP